MTQWSPVKILLLFSLAMSVCVVYRTHVSISKQYSVTSIDTPSLKNWLISPSLPNTTSSSSERVDPDGASRYDTEAKNLNHPASEHRANLRTVSSESTSFELIIHDDEGDDNNGAEIKAQAKDDKFNLARTQSFGFFNDITNDNWKLLQNMVAQHWNHKFPERPLTHHPSSRGGCISANTRWRKRCQAGQPTGIYTPAWYQSNFEPNFSCQFEKRIGATSDVSRGNGDGPKWICDPHRIKRLASERKAKDPNHPGCVVYSIGSAGDFSFEKGMEEELGPGTCEYHIFDMGDFKEKMELQNISRAHFHRWGLDTQREGNLQPGKEFHGLQDTVFQLGHENLDVIDVFKIDCEKCEWRIYKDWLLPGLPSLQQIQVEIHSGDINKMHDADNHGHDTAPEIPFFEFLEEAGYVRFHKEPNIQFSDGSCQEYAFLKLDKEFFAARKKVLAERNTTRIDIYEAKAETQEATEAVAKSISMKQKQKLKKLRKLWKNQHAEGQIAETEAKIEPPAPEAARDNVTTPEGIPEAMPEVPPAEATPDAAPEAEATPAAQPEKSSPDTAPEAKAEASPKGTTPDAAPKAAKPDITPEIAAKPEDAKSQTATPDAASNAAPEAKPDATPEVATPDAQPEAATPEAATPKITSPLASFVKKHEGSAPNSWRVVEWDNNPISPEEEGKFKCEYVDFKSAESGKSAHMCVHTFHDYVSNEIRRLHHWADCDLLSKTWNASVKKSNRDSSSLVYIEVGANIGSCVMEMLLGTDAPIIAFEPHPMNLFNMKKTISHLDKSYQDRVTLFPIGLGDLAGSSTIYAANNNMGNSVVGKIIKDDPSQKFDEKLQFTINLERLDSLLDSNNLYVGLMKIDMQGFECKFLEGAGEEIMKKVEKVKFEYASHWLKNQDCTDLLPRLRNYGFDIFHREGGTKLEGEPDYKDTDIVVDFIAKRQQSL